MSRWFVMLYTYSGDPALMVVGGPPDEDWSDDPALFNSEAEAGEVAKTSPLGRAYGYELYEWPG